MFACLDINRKELVKERVLCDTWQQQQLSRGWKSKMEKSVKRLRFNDQDQK